MPEHPTTAVARPHSAAAGLPPGAGPAAAAARTYVVLRGHPTLRRFLDFAEQIAPDPSRVDRRALSDEWRATNDYYQGLEDTEAGIANQCGCDELPPSLLPLAARVAAHPSFGPTFEILPTRFGMVELDRLIVYQNYVTLDYAQALRQRLGPDPGLTDLFNTCLPLDEPSAPVEVQRVGSRRFILRSESTQFRYREPELLQPDPAAVYQGFGTSTGMVGLLLGFRANFLNVVQVGKRMILNNGYHRAYALRALGISHVPCVIQSASHVDEVNLAVNTRVTENVAFFLQSARPPLLKDFFDPQIFKLLAARRRRRQLEIRIDVDDQFIYG